MLSAPEWVKVSTDAGRLNRRCAGCVSPRRAPARRGRGVPIRPSSHLRELAAADHFAAVQPFKQFFRVTRRLSAASTMTPRSRTPGTWRCRASGRGSLFDELAKAPVPGRAIHPESARDSARVLAAVDEPLHMFRLRPSSRVCAIDLTRRQIKVGMQRLPEWLGLTPKCAEPSSRLYPMASNSCAPASACRT